MILLAGDPHTRVSHPALMCGTWSDPGWVEQGARVATYRCLQQAMRRSKSSPFLDVLNENCFALIMPDHPTDPETCVYPIGALSKE